MNARILVAYFSASGVTARAAKEIAAAVGADLYEIRPQQPYTAADLRYNDSNSRVCKEHADESLRNVELTTTDVENWDKYDVVFVGYPIWNTISRSASPSKKIKPNILIQESMIPGTDASLILSASCPKDTPPPRKTT